MKIRTGFVSNSSSTNFTCCISGKYYEGRDGEYKNVCNRSYDCGHESESIYYVDLNSANLSTEDKRAILLWWFEYEDWDSEKGEEYKHAKHANQDTIEKEFTKYTTTINTELSSKEEPLYDMPACLCPLCTFTHIPHENAYKYVIKKHFGGIEKTLTDEIKNKFSSINQLRDFIDDK